MWFEEISLRGFPRKLKSVGRMAVAETAAAAAETDQNNESPGYPGWLNTLRPRQNGRHFPDAIFKWIFLNENVWMSNKISLKFVPKVTINNIPALVQIMAWHPSGHKPLSEPMMDSLLTHICVTRPQWVNQQGIPGRILPCHPKPLPKNNKSAKGAAEYLTLAEVIR